MGTGVMAQRIATVKHQDLIISAHGHEEAQGGGAEHTAD